MIKKIVFIISFTLFNIYLASSKQSNNTPIVNSNDAFNKSERIYFNSDSTEREKLEQLSKAWMDAMIRHDTSTLKYIMAPGFKLQRWDGSTPIYRATWLDNLLNHIQIIKFEQTNIFAEVHGDVALVTSLYSWVGTFKNNPFDSKGYLVDTWIRNGNHWQVISRTNGTFVGSKTLDGK